MSLKVDINYCKNHKLLTIFYEYLLHKKHLKVSKILQFCIKNFCEFPYWFTYYLYVSLLDNWHRHILLGLGRSTFNFQISGVNFTNILQAAFTLTYPESAKKLLDLTVFFALLVSACIKAAHRSLINLTPDI